MVYLLALLGFLFFAGVAMTIGEGLWSNTILLLCILLSSLAGAVFGVPFGTYLLEMSGKDDTFAWYFVLTGMWAAFVIFLIVLRIISDKASRVRVRFLPVVDKIGGILMGFLAATMLASFAAFTLVRAPIAAGEWKTSDASESVQNGFALAQNPFRIVLKSFTSAEGVDSPFYGK